MIETKYKVGDTVIINDKDWVIDEIKMRFGRTWVYGLSHDNPDGTNDSFTIETGSLETIIK